MIRTICLVLGAAAIGSSAFAQSNERGPGYDAALTNAYGATDWGRRGPAYPNGEVAVSFANQLCNPGSINVNWFSPGGSIGATIQEDHPKFGFLVARELDGRLIQVSDWSYCKHAFFALSSPSVCGGTCQGTNGTQLGVSCSDVYSNGNNGSRTYLGPPSEIDPWLGSWEGTGSYFDVGDPGQGNFPQPADGLRSLSTGHYDAVDRRVTMLESLIPSGGQMFFHINVIIEGERIENRANNIGSNTMTMVKNATTSNGTSAWSTTTTGSMQQGSVLHRWAGATVTRGSNGGTLTHTDDDGRFEVAVKVTGPTNGLWHYEYVVHNLDNSRGGASFRLPVCDGARVENIGFRDIDQNPLNDWTSSVAGGEIAWQDAGGNALNWNTLYNFWFDCDVAPASGDAVLDQARMGPGALDVTVPTTVPGLQPSVWLGDGCGTPGIDLVVNDVPSAGNSGFQIDLVGTAGAPALVYFSENTTALNLGSGCTLLLDLNAFGTVGLFVLDGAGEGAIPIPVPAGLMPADLYFQGATFPPSPPLFGFAGLTNALLVRFANPGCQ